MNHSTHSTLDASIPLLTEIIAPAELAAVDDTSAQAVAPIAGTADKIGIDDEAVPQRTPSEMTLSHLDWERLEHDVHAKVLRQLLERIDFVIEQRVRDSLADVLQTAVQGMAEQIKTGLHHTLDEVISRAVTLEISKLQKTTF